MIVYVRTSGHGIDLGERTLRQWLGVVETARGDLASAVDGDGVGQRDARRSGDQRVQVEGPTAEPQHRTLPVVLRVLAGRRDIRVTHRFAVVTDAEGVARYARLADAAARCSRPSRSQRTATPGPPHWRAGARRARILRDASGHFSEIIDVVRLSAVRCIRRVQHAQLPGRHVIADGRSIRGAHHHVERIDRRRDSVQGPGRFHTIRRTDQPGCPETKGVQWRRQPGIATPSPSHDVTAVAVGGSPDLQGPARRIEKQAFMTAAKRPPHAGKAALYGFEPEDLAAVVDGGTERKARLCWSCQLDRAEPGGRNKSGVPRLKRRRRRVGLRVAPEVGVDDTEVIDPLDRTAGDISFDTTRAQ